MKITAFDKVPGATALAWLGYWLVWVLMLSNGQQPVGPLWPATVNVALQAAVVYVNMLLLIPAFLEKRRYVVYGLFCFTLLFILSKVQVTLVQADVKMLLKRNIQYPRAFQFARIYLFLMVVLIASTAWKFAADRFNALQMQTETSKQQLESELQLLKNQINPHFLFNTLNNIYTLAYLKEDNAAPMIMKLSQLLRYMLYQCQGERVDLVEEVAFLSNIVEMQRLKSPIYAQRISFGVNGVRPGQQIAPLLLLAFFENSFKHSDLDLNPDGCISIKLDVFENGNLSFHCFNTKRTRAAADTQPGGIGLANVRKRLELTYPGSHSLEIDDEADKFEIRLTLIL